MAKARFEGIIPPVLTIFTDQGAFDPKGQALLLDKVIAGGVDGVFMCGTAGEVSQMTTTERKEIAEFTVRHVGGRVKVLLGIGSNNPREAVELARHAEEIGADGILAVNLSYWVVSEIYVIGFLSFME